MPKITRLQFQSRTKNTLVYLDDEFFFSLKTEIVLKNHLKLKQILSTQKIHKLILESLSVQLTDSVFQKISIRPRSCYEIKKYLEKKIYKIKKNIKIQLNKQKTDTLINQIIIKLQKKDYLNDQSFAKWWIENRIDNKPRGKRALSSELYKKGISSKIINRILSSGIITKKDNQNMIKKIINKSYKSLTYKNYDKNKMKNALIRRLQYKGFSYHEFKNEIDEFLQKKYNKQSRKSKL